MPAQPYPLPAIDPAEPAYKWLETLPPWAVYLPVGLWSVVCALRYRSLRAPLAANTCFPAGGLSGESKIRVLDQIRGDSRRFVADYGWVERGPGPASADFGRARAAMAAAGLDYPVVAKPDLGTRGIGVGLIGDDDDLLSYIDGFPRWERIVLQRYVADTGEAGVFYIRPPDETHGFLFSLSLKYFPEVHGDGRSSLRQLIADHPRAGRLPWIYEARQIGSLERVPAAGERIRLASIGNRSRGAWFRDGRPYITEAMSARFDAIARDIPGFHFGRFDVRFAGLDRLQAGEDFRIIEVNGAGSEATHVWDARIGAGRMYRDLFRQISWLWRIGSANRARGAEVETLAAWLRMVVHEKGLAARYPLTD